MATATTSEDQYRKCFIPLESNPEVFTELMQKLTDSDTLAFQDVLSLDDRELLAFIPRPAYALVLVFPTTNAYEKRCADEAARLGEYDGCGKDEPMVFFKQTIHNACGLYALLHAISNGEARQFTGKDSIMVRLLDAAVPLKPEERALVLEDSKELESAYASVASKGDTQAPNADGEVDFHYICFVKSHQNGHLFQMDGDQERPVDLGPIGADEDVLSDACLGVIRGLIEEDETGNVNFSLMALISEV